MLGVTSNQPLACFAVLLLSVTVPLRFIELKSMMVERK
jgi:hypothetical protein